MNNRALVFIKPHAVTDQFIRFVENFLDKNAVALSEPRTIGAAEIKKKGIVDAHYSAIARTAVFQQPSEYNLGEAAKQKFKEAFQLSWDEALDSKKLFNSVETQKRLGNLSGIELNEIWARSPQAKLAPGLYAGYIEKEDLYCINGFYPGQREVFTAEGAEVILYEADFNPQDLSWQSFRQEVIGATDPSQAAGGSLRNQLLEHFTEFGLTTKPVTSKNGIHASAGPLEGLRERMVWLGLKLEDDPFAVSLLEGGMDRKKLEELLENPVVTIGAETDPVFDLTEDTDSEPAAEMLLKKYA